MKTIREESNLRKTARLVCLCGKEETELGRQQAPGSCPYCGGKVQMLDVERKWMFCFVPLFQDQEGSICVLLAIVGSFCTIKLIIF